MISMYTINSKDHHLRLFFFHLLYLWLVSVGVCVDRRPVCGGGLNGGHNCLNNLMFRGDTIDNNCYRSLVVFFFCMVLPD